MILEFLVAFIRIFFDLLGFAIIARILMSWMPNGAPRLRQILNDVTEPVLAPFRRIVPRIGMMDISPIVAIIALDIIKAGLLYLIAYAALNI